MPIKPELYDVRASNVTPGEASVGLGGRFTAWRMALRERRAMAGMGALGRLEVHCLLLASGAGGLPERVWPAAQRGEDVLACGISPQVQAVATAHSAAVLRNFSR